jgi:hypothetical protein
MMRGISNNLYLLESTGVQNVPGVHRDEKEPNFRPLIIEKNRAGTPT